MHSYLKHIVYDKLLKPRQSFLITLYFSTQINTLTSTLQSILLLVLGIPETVPSEVLPNTQQHGILSLDYLELS